MKQRILSAFSIMILLGVLISAPAYSVPIVNLNLIDSPVGVGDTFQVAVWADGDDIGLDFLSYGFDVGFDNGDIFGFTGYTLGTGFDDDSFGPDNVAGSIFPGLSDDNILLATLSFETSDFGTDTLNVVGLYDEMFSGMYYELPDWRITGYDINASLTISVAATQVPEPATILLLSIGLAILAGMRPRLIK